MSELRERSTKKLAELKAYLEKKVLEDEEEIRTLRSFLEVIDLLLTERSYRRVEVPKTQADDTKKQEAPRRASERSAEWSWLTCTLTAQTYASCQVKE